MRNALLVCPLFLLGIAAAAGTQGVPIWSILLFPLLFTAGMDGTVAVLDARTGRLRHAEKNLGQSPWFFLTPRGPL